jgi:glutamyl-tRNA reductase
MDSSSSFVMVGASHRTAPLSLLERLSVPTSELPPTLEALTAGADVAGVVVLSTCNRTELYACCRRFHGGVEELVSFLARRAGLPVAELVPHLSVLHDDTALTHLFRVAAGAESVAVGETEILGQVQRALSAAEELGSVPPLLSRGFRHAVRAGRRARAETGIGEGTTSLPWLAVRQATDRCGTLGDRQALVVGAGEMGGAVAAALARAGVAGIAVAGRGTERAAAVAAAVGGRLVAPEGLSEALQAADVVFTATTSAGCLLDRKLCASVMARRPHRPLVVIDLALPRDVDPHVATLSGVTLLDLDDLRATASEALAGRRRHLPEVDRLVATEVERFLRETSAREMGPLVSALRCRIEDVRRAELRRWQARLGALDPQALALAEEITAGVVAKLLHGPTVRLKDAAGTAEAELYRHALVELFELSRRRT